MESKIIRLNDGMLVEVDTFNDGSQQISGNVMDKVDSTLEKIKPFLVKSCQPVFEAITEIEDKSMIEAVELDFSLGFEGEGNIYITKAKAKANMNLKIKFKFGN